MFDLDSLNQSFFTWKTALSLALASDLAYQPGQAVENVAVRNWKLDRCQFLERHDTECFVADTDSAIVVSFRGTESFNDWIADLNVWSTTKPYGSVHRGFVTAYEQIAADLVATINDFQPLGKVLHFAGHSLGAALATIAACELHDSLPIAGVYTFGQPRMGDRVTAEFITAKYPRGFHRFVFDDDIVTRIPPGYHHVGTLYHFDSNGFLQRSTSETTGGSTETPPLSKSEFQDLKANAKAIGQAATVAVGAEEASEVADRSLEGIFPSISDHRMSRYLFAIRNQLPRSMEFVSESTVYQPLEMFEAAVYKVARNTSELYPVQVRVRDLKWQPPSTAVVSSQVGPIYSLRATKDDISHMQHDDGVASVNISRELDFRTAEECAVSVPFVGGDAVHSGNINEQGNLAVVALIDSGIDILHEAFLDGNQQTRIDAIWVQSDSSGMTPKQVDANLYTQDYGTLYQFAEIQTYVNNDLINNNNTTPATLRDVGPSVLRDYGHGTHVASIAAGRAVGTFAGGMAPASRIVVVVPHMKTCPPNPPSLGYSNSHQDALAFLLAYKRAKDLPMAVNVSQGMNAGAHDGMSDLEKVFDSISIKGKEPGFVIVKSAGNERGHQGHARVQASTAGIVTVEWDSQDLDRTDDYLECWYHSDDDLQFQLEDPAGTRSAHISVAHRSERYSSAGNDIYLDLTPHHPDNDDNLLRIRVYPVFERIQSGRWILEIQANSLGPMNGIVDAWVERSDNRPVKFVTGIADDSMTLSVPGTAETVISVSATNSSNQLRLHDESSYGPTRKQGPKPDVCAPGTRIIAARSNSIDHQAVVTMSGTSMAAPHVTGALALVLSARHKKCATDPSKSQFNVTNLAGILKRSSENYNRLHNKGYGYGRLNALRLFTEADLA